MTTIALHLHARPVSLLTLVSRAIPAYKPSSDIATGVALVTGKLNANREDPTFIGSVTANLTIPRAVIKHDLVDHYRERAIENVLAAYAGLTGVTLTVDARHGKTVFTAVFDGTPVAPLATAPTHDWSSYYAA